MGETESLHNGPSSTQETWNALASKVALLVGPHTPEQEIIITAGYKDLLQDIFPRQRVRGGAPQLAKYVFYQILGECLDMTPEKNREDILSPKEVQILIGTYGLDGEPELSRAEIARRLVLSDSRISQLKHKALLTLGNSTKYREGFSQLVDLPSAQPSIRDQYIRRP